MLQFPATFKIGPTHQPFIQGSIINKQIHNEQPARKITKQTISLLKSFMKTSKYPPCLSPAWNWSIFSPQKFVNNPPSHQVLGKYERGQQTRMRGKVLLSLSLSHSYQELSHPIKAPLLWLIEYGVATIVSDKCREKWGTTRERQSGPLLSVHCVTYWIWSSAVLYWH